MHVCRQGQGVQGVTGRYDSGNHATGQGHWELCIITQKGFFQSYEVHSATSWSQTADLCHTNHGFLAKASPTIAYLLDAIGWALERPIKSVDLASSGNCVALFCYCFCCCFSVWLGSFLSTVKIGDRMVNPPHLSVRPCRTTAKRWQLHSKRRQQNNNNSNTRVPNKNGVSQAWYTIEIHHSGRKPSKQQQ